MMLEQVFTTACEGSTPEQMAIPEGTSPLGKPIPGHRESVRRKEQKRKTLNY